jgi:hypothetical protein
LRVNWYENVREHVRKLSQTPEFAIARRDRNKIETVAALNQADHFAEESFSTASKVYARRTQSI